MTVRRQQECRPGGAQQRCRATTARNQRGSALVLVLLSLSTAGLLAGALVVLTAGDALVALRNRQAEEAAAAATALAEAVVSELRREPDWDVVLAGGAVSAFYEPFPATLPDGRTIDPAAETARLTMWSAAEPWGAGNPAWRLFASGRGDALLPGVPGAMELYLMAWVADDGADGDGMAERDGNGVIRVWAEAHGAGGLRRAVAATLGRLEPAPGPLRRLAWRSVR